MFKKGFDADSFEKELTELTESINSTQNQIIRLKAKDKLTRKWLIQYIVVGYVIVNGYNFMKLPPSTTASNRVVRYFSGLSTHQLLVVIFYPVVGYLVTYLCRMFFNVLIRSRNNHLKHLKKKHLVKIDDLKKITNYNKTKTLLNKYSDNDSELKQRTTEKSLPQNQPNAQSGVPRKKVDPTVEKVKKELNLDINVNPLEPAALAPKPSYDAINDQLQVKLNHKRTFQERMLDLLIGSDNNESIESRFALICYNCYAHNGLAPPGTTNPLHVKYICFKCGCLNGDVDLKGTGSASESVEDVTSSKTAVEAPASASASASASDNDVFKENKEVIDHGTTAE